MNKLNVKPRTIFCKDNLEILEGINSNCIDLIYLDPPFNTKKVFTAPIGSSAEGAEFSDIFRKEDIKNEWVKSIEFESPYLHNFLQHTRVDDISYNYCYLVYMAIRLIECRRILKTTGSIYLHCDPTMSHYLKIVLDCIFGEDNFRNEIIWCYSNSGRNKKKFTTKHDVIMFYHKTKKGKFDYKIPISKEYLASHYKHKDSAGNRCRKRTDAGKERIYYPDDGVTCNDWWADIPSLNAIAKERTGYPTQKPLALLERIISASTNEGDVVLDPFCGCATTCVAAEKLDRQWIGIDISQKAYELVKMRLEKEVPSDMLRAEPKFTTITPIRNETKEEAQGGYVYVIKNDNWEGMYKVGITKDVKKRLNSYQTSDPYRAYTVVYEKQTPYYREIEKHIHTSALFKADYEWVEGDLAEIIAEIENYNPLIETSSNQDKKATQ